MSNHPRQCRTLPVTYPSLFIGSVSVPFPMSQSEFDFLIDAIRSWEKSLVKESQDGAEPNPQERSDA